MEELFDYRMTETEKTIWCDLRDDIINEILAIHIPVVDDRHIIECVTEDMEAILPYIGIQGYKCDYGFYFIEDDNRREPKLRYVSQNYEEVKQKYLRKEAQAIAVSFVRANRELIKAKWESNTWSMTGKTEASGVKNQKFDTRKYEYDIEIYIMRKLLSEDVTANEIKRKLSNLKYDKDNKWIYSESDYAFIIIQ